MANRIRQSKNTWCMSLYSATRRLGRRDEIASSPASRAESDKLVAHTVPSMLLSAAVDVADHPAVFGTVDGPAAKEGRSANVRV